MSDIFISYSREDSQFVDALIMALIEYGWSVWSDKSGMSEGRPFDQQIENAIMEATVALVVWSHSSVKSRWVRAEAAFALDKDKLIPVIADGSDPPLQFLHIQSVSMADWHRTNDDPAFKKLAAMLSQRLDQVGRIPQLDKKPSLPAKAETSTLGHVFTSWKSLRDAAFPPVGPGFSEYYANRTFFITQFACIFGFCLVTLFGLNDFFAQSGGVEQTRFRFMVTGPSLLIMLALSFTTLAKRHSQTFALVFGCLALLINFKSMTLVESSFPASTGAATTAFLVVIAVTMVLPLRAINAALLGALTFALHERYILNAPTPISTALLTGYSICVLSAGLASVAVAYFRERVLRKCFNDFDQASAKMAELKDRLMALAVQRRQAQAPDRSLQAGE